MLGIFSRIRSSRVRKSPSHRSPQPLAHRAVRMEFLEERRLLAIVQHSGDITENETWSGADVHVIASTVTVKPGVTLTIESGAVVKRGDEPRLDR